MKIEEVFINNINIIENHRNKVEETQIHELMSSIKQHGLQQPIGLTPNNKKGYDLVFGNRRLIACEKLGWTKITASIMDKMEMKKFLVLQLTENMQRKDPTFPEFGRAIERLIKLGLDIPQVAVRLGVEESKVRMILRTYTTLPAKHRDKVSFMGKGTKASPGAIPPQVATGIIRMKKDFGLSDKNLDALIAHVGKGDLVRDNLRSLACLLRTGIKFEEALEKLFDYEVYTLVFVANRLEVGKAVTETGSGSAQILFKRILYGKLSGLKQPDFVKI